MKTGHAFGEHINTGKFKRRRYDDSPTQLNERSFLFPSVLVIIAALLIFRTFYLQIIKGNDFQALSDSNRIRTQIIHAPRGVVFDSNGTPLVQNTPGFRQIENNSKADEPDKTKILNKDQALPLIAAGDKNIEVASLRQYPYKDRFSHVLGYIGQISKEELDYPEFSDYQGTDWIGKSGIEREYEHILRGIDGKQLIEVDALGKEVRSLGQTDPIPGQDITLTLDIKLQKAAEEAAKNVKRGAIIVSKPDGQILAMFSKPSYDPNLFTLDKTYKPASESAYQNTQDILTDTETQPLLHRAIAGIYPPGSTFKIITAAAGLEQNIIDEKYTVRDTGIIKVGEFSFANWYYTNYGKTEPGNLDVIRALSRSNDIFFYKLGEKVGVDRLSITAEKFGLGSELGIDLGGEESGLVPTKKWKKEQIGESWYLGDNFHYGIGQGYLLTTPLQVNAFTQVVANGGTLYQPRLLKNQESKTKNKGLLTEENTSLIRQGMIDSCKPTIGVAHPLFNFKVPTSAKASAGKEKFKIDGKNFMDTPASGSAKMTEVSIACKTGTAQHGGEETLPHAWITLFAPAYDPEIVVTVLNEESGEGSNEAAPIAKKILEAYFSEK